MDYNSHYNREYLDYNAHELVSGLEFSCLISYIEQDFAGGGGEGGGGGGPNFGGGPPHTAKAPGVHRSIALPIQKIEINLSKKNNVEFSEAMLFLAQRKKKMEKKWKKITYTNN
jgi:hypothetical protein